MALIILEGLDRVGKTSVAQFFETQGYEVIHMSAPPKGQTSDAFLEEMMGIVSSAAHKDVILDRSYYGETVWSKVYGREPLIDDQGLEVLRELEDSVGSIRVLMHDTNSEAHWQRCVDNKEPLTKTQFVKARSLYSAMADKYDFERKTLKDFPDAVQPLPPSDKAQRDLRVVNGKGTQEQTPNTASKTESNPSKDGLDNKTKEQLKLERANVINDVLSKRVIKAKGPMYDELERSVRHFLNGELGKIFGNTVSNSNFNAEEVELLKFFCQRLKDKES